MRDKLDSRIFSHEFLAQKFRMRLPRAHALLCQIAFTFALALVFAGCSSHASPPSENQNAAEEAVHFASGNISLAGTLVLPSGSQPHPAVVLFHGSGPQGRDLFMARWFAAQGVAALAYDKRGVGESAGDFRDVAFMDLCDDGLAAIAYLKSRKEIDPKHIGVWGLSQGGWLGPLAASRSSNVSFVIAVSGPGVSPGEQMIFYSAEELRARGLHEEDVREASTLRRDIWNYFSSGKGYNKANDELTRARAKPWFQDVKNQQDNSFAPLPTPAELSKPTRRSSLWYTREMNYDPVLALQALHVPALFLFGDQDRLVPVEESVAIIRQTLTNSGNHDFTIQIFHNADHAMRLTTGDGEVDPEYLDTMRNWLVAKVGASH